MECNSAHEGWPCVQLIKDQGYRAYLFSSTAFNSNNFFGNKKNIFYDARELGLLLVPDCKFNFFLSQTNEETELIEIKTLEDLFLALLKKPQYKEVLSKSGAAKIWGCDFWKNEPESKLLNQSISQRELNIQALNQSLSDYNQGIDNLKRDIQKYQFFNTILESEVRKFVIHIHGK